MKTRGLINFKGRIFSLGFLKPKTRRQKGALLRYYRKPKEDTRSAFGKKVDFLIGLLLAWAAGFFILANLTGRPVTALALSLPLLAVEAVLLKRIMRRREEQRRQQKRLWLSGQKFAENIARMDPVKEFRPYVQDILGSLPGFQEVRLTPGGAGESGCREGIDLEGVYKGLPVAVRCLHPEGDKKTGPAEVRAFARALGLGGYKKGLLITSGVFGDGVLRAVREASRKGAGIKLVDRYKLMELARQADAGAVPVEESTPGVASRSAGEKWPVLSALRDSALGSRKKAKSYFMYGLLLLGGYFLLRGSFYLSLIYLFFASLNILLGAASLFYGKTIEEMDPLEGLESEK